MEPLRTLGAHPADGEPVTLWEGRYGPYVKHGDVNASLPKGVSHEDFTLDAALPLIAERAATAKPKKGRGARSSAKSKTAASAKKTSSAAKPKTPRKAK